METIAIVLAVLVTGIVGYDYMHKDTLPTPAPIEQAQAAEPQPEQPKAEEAAPAPEAVPLPPVKEKKKKKQKKAEQLPTAPDQLKKHKRKVCTVVED